jgi:hypothetical protein
MSHESNYAKDDKTSENTRSTVSKRDENRISSSRNFVLYKNIEKLFNKNVMNTCRSCCESDYNWPEL